MMRLLFDLEPDIIVVLVLLAIVLAVFLLSRINLLPKRSMSYVGAAIVGMVTFGLFNRWKFKKYLAEYDEAKKDADKTKHELEEMQRVGDLNQAERDRVMSGRQARIDALKQEIALSNAGDAERRRAIEAMSDQELDREIEKIRAGRG